MQPSRLGRIMPAVTKMIAVAVLLSGSSVYTRRFPFGGRDDAPWCPAGAGDHEIRPARDPAFVLSQPGRLRRHYETRVRNLANPPATMPAWAG